MRRHRKKERRSQNTHFRSHAMSCTVRRYTCCLLVHTASQLTLSFEPKLAGADARAIRVHVFGTSGVGITTTVISAATRRHAVTGASFECKTGNTGFACYTRVGGLRHVSTRVGGLRHVSTRVGGWHCFSAGISDLCCWCTCIGVLGCFLACVGDWVYCSARVGRLCG